MKANSVTRKERRQAFTLIEMIGVLAVIAILAALLIPKVFEAINNSRINNAVVSYNTVKAACMDHYAKFGGMDKTTGGTAVPAGAPPGGPTPTAGLAYYDAVLLNEGFLDKPFLVKVGTNSYAHVVTTATTYDLAGNTTNSTLGASYVVEAVIQGVPAGDAKDISDRLDGSAPPLNAPAAPADDITGRVKYSNATQTVWIYLTHR